VCLHTEEVIVGWHHFESYAEIEMRVVHLVQCPERDLG
jgi:hypothetical protein